MTGPMYIMLNSRFLDLINKLDLDIKAVNGPFSSLCHEKMIPVLRMKGVLALMTGVEPQPLDMMKKIDIIQGLIYEEFLFKKIY